jgi:hypothetical protein
MGSVSSILTTVLNFLFVFAVALGLSKEDIKMVFFFSLGYALTGLCFSSTIPEFLYSKGVISKEEKKSISELLLVSWVVTIPLLIPKIRSAVK